MISIYDFKRLCSRCIKSIFPKEKSFYSLWHVTIVKNVWNGTSKFHKSQYHTCTLFSPIYFTLLFRSLSKLEILADQWLKCRRAFGDTHMNTHTHTYINIPYVPSGLYPPFNPTLFIQYLPFLEAIIQAYLETNLTLPPYWHYAPFKMPTSPQVILPPFGVLPQAIISFTKPYVRVRL